MSNVQDFVSKEEQRERAESYQDVLNDLIKKTKKLQDDFNKVNMLEFECDPEVGTTVQDQLDEIVDALESMLMCV